MFTVRFISFVGLTMLLGACGTSVKHVPPTQNVDTAEVKLIDPYSYHCSKTLVQLGMSYTYVLSVNKYGDKNVFGDVNTSTASAATTVTYTANQPINYTVAWQADKDANRVLVIVDDKTSVTFTFSEKTDELTVVIDNADGSHEYTDYCAFNEG